MNLSCQPRYGVNEIRALTGNWKVIYIIRNGRNQIESLRNIPGGVEMERHNEDPEDYFEVLCKGFRNRARIALDCEAQLSNFKMFRFEDLVSDPVYTIRMMYHHAGLVLDEEFVRRAYQCTLDNNMIKQHSSFGSAKNLHKRWVNWTEKEQAIFNKIAGKELEELGYE